MKAQFTHDEYTLLHKIAPGWEHGLKGYSRDTLASQLDRIFPGFNLLKATALYEHLQRREASLARQLAGAVGDGDTKQAIAVLESIAKYKGNQGADEAYVRPEHFPWTWAEEEWQAELFRGRAQLDGIERKKAIGRTQVMGIWAGTGNGKSHRLMQLKHFDPRMQLRAYEANQANRPLHATERKRVDVPAVDRFVYITLNMGQMLTFDRERPHRALILRTMLRDMGLTNRGCDTFFCDHAEALTEIEAPSLVELCVEYFRAKGARHVGIAVDEVRMLLYRRDDAMHDSIPVLTSRLGALAAALEDQGVACTAIVSSLTSETFSSESGRPVTEVYPPAIGPDGIRFIIQHGLPAQKQTAKNVSMVMAASGSHFRSAIHAINAVRDNEQVSPMQLFKSVASSIDTNLQLAERKYIREHIVGMMAKGEGVSDHRQRFVDQQKAVAPPYVLAAFRQQDGFEPNMHPAEKMFEVSAFVDAPKQLEMCGMYYDMLRALYMLPVVPPRIVVNNSRAIRNLSRFQFSEFVASNPVSTDSIFETKNDEVRLVPGWSPPDDQYMLPSASNHPLIDRACVAFDPITNERCLVIYQDKINASGFSAAVKALNDAATMLQRRLGYPVLCVAHVVQASAKTTAQRNFHHPFVLIREPEASQYYTPTFAIPIQCVRERHNQAPLVAI